MTEDEGDVLWEPNCTYDLEPFQIKNAGNLALKYKVTLKATKIDKAADGDTIMLTGDVALSGETVSVDKDLTIKGEDTTLQNAYLEVADGKELSFDGVTIADTTTIRTKDAADLTFTNCEFNVTPEKKNNNSRAAAIIGNHQYSNVNLTLQGCTFTCDPQVGSFDEQGVFHAVSTPASGNLYVTYKGITASQRVTIMEAQWQLVSDSVVIDQFHPYAINICGVSGYGLDKVDPSVVAWTSADEQVCAVDNLGIITAVTDGQTYVGSSHPLLADSLLVSVENPKGRVTTIENGPIDPASWDIAQSGGKDRVVTALDNGLKIDFLGASSRNPYIKISKALQLWGLPDTLRLRIEPQCMISVFKILCKGDFPARKIYCSLRFFSVKVRIFPEDLLDLADIDRLYIALACHGCS